MALHHPRDASSPWLLIELMAVFCADETIHFTVSLAQYEQSTQQYYSVALPFCFFFFFFFACKVLV